jgi:hypothetical protein
MKSGTALFLLIFPAVVLADFKLEKDYEPPVDFPVAHFDGKRRVEARVSYTISNDGTVSAVELENTTNPKFGEYARKIMAQSRFKPWPLEGNPGTVRYESFIISSLDQGLYQKYKTKIGRLRCIDLNKEVTQFRLQSPGKPLRDMNLFFETLIALRMTSEPVNGFTHEEAGRWSDALQGALPLAVSTCQKSPAGTYLNALPKSLRDRFEF